ncbi:nitrogenase component 1 [Fusobacterium ulcerans]
MNGIKMAENLKKLRDVKKIKDVEPLSNALFPGYHCPLMGAMLTIKEIEDAIMMVIGPDECTYYTKMATSRMRGVGMTGAVGASGGLEGNIVSLVLDGHDVTFGCKEKLEEAFEELVEEYQPKTVFLVTTCVVEVIGDDIDSLAEIFEERYNFPVKVVHAENFKTDDHLPGIQDTMTVCVDLMEEQECNGSVNVLGQRLGDFNRSELYRILKEAEVPKGLQLPGHCTLEQIKTAPSAKVNIIVHPIGLPLAKKMKKKFGTPYIMFERMSAPDNIYNSYKELFQLLEKPLPEEVEMLYRTAKEKEKEVKNSIEKLKYFSGNTALSTYEFHSYLIELGLDPILIQTSDIPSEDNHHLKIILEKADPFITRAANIGPLKYLYSVLKPDLSIGAGNSAEMRKYGVVPTVLTNAYNILGFEVNSMVLETISKANKDVKYLKGGVKNEFM